MATLLKKILVSSFLLVVYGCHKGSKNLEVPKNGTLKKDSAADGPGSVNGESGSTTGSTGTGSSTSGGGGTGGSQDNNGAQGAGGNQANSDANGGTNTGETDSELQDFNKNFVDYWNNKFAKHLSNIKEQIPTDQDSIDEKKNKLDNMWARVSRFVTHTLPFFKNNLIEELNKYKGKSEILKSLEKFETVCTNLGDLQSKLKFIASVAGTNEQKKLISDSESCLKEIDDALKASGVSAMSS